MEKKATIKGLLLVLLKIGTLGFGGGPGMVALLRQELVGKRDWISDEEFAAGVGMGQMVPGPFVPHYVQYIGYRLFGIRGAALAVITFLLPSLLLVLLISSTVCQ